MWQWADSLKRLFRWKQRGAERKRKRKRIKVEQMVTGVTCPKSRTHVSQVNFERRGILTLHSFPFAAYLHSTPPPVPTSQAFCNDTPDGYSDTHIYFRQQMFNGYEDYPSYGGFGMGSRGGGFSEQYRCYSVAMMQGNERQNVNNGGKSMQLFQSV